MKLDHIHLAMPEGCEDQARQFFCGLLDMEKVEKPEPLRQRGGCWFRKNLLHLHIGVENPFKNQKKAHPAFCVEKLDTLAIKLENCGFPVIWDDALSDRKRFYTTDPFGNRLEFLQDGDGFSQR